MIASKKSSDRLRRTPRPLITLRATAAPRPRSWPSRASSFSGNGAPSQMRLRNRGPLPAKCLLVSLHPFQRPGCGRGGSAGGRGGLGYGGGFGRVLMRRSPAVAAARAPGRRRGRRDGLPDALDYDTQLLIGTLEAHQAREGSWGTFRTKDRPGGECASAPQRDDGGTFARADEGCDVAAHAARTHRAPVPGRASASGRRLRPNL